MGKIHDLTQENAKLKALNAKLLKEGVEQETRLQRLEASNRALNAAIQTHEKTIKRLKEEAE